MPFSKNAICMSKFVLKTMSQTTKILNVCLWASYASYSMLLFGSRFSGNFKQYNFSNLDLTSSKCKVTQLQVKLETLKRIICSSASESD